MPYKQPMRYIVLVSLAWLCACSSAEERKQEQAARQVASCRKVGYQPGTAGYDNCLQQLQDAEGKRRQDRIDAGESVRQIQSGRSMRPW